MKKRVILLEGNVKGIKARTVLWYLAFFGFAINTIVRINSSIAIVDMIDFNLKKSTNVNKTVAVSECLAKDDKGAQNGTISIISNIKLVNTTRYVSMERKILDYFEIEYERDGFKWNEHKQGMYLGSFYWLHWMSQIPGGILATKFGTKTIFGLANFIPCALCLLTPIVSYLDYKVLVILRITSGVCTGLSWPAMHHLIGLWIPGNERSRFVTVYLGTGIGAAIAFPIFGYIIKISSWEWVFHFCFIVGTIWYIFWMFLVFDSPEVHPRIDPAEKEYIIKSLGSSVFREKDKHERRKIPWKAILTSRCTWVTVLADLGNVWGLFTILTQSPTYFRFIHGWSIEMVGILSGFPHLMRVLASFVFSSIGDYLLTGDRMSREHVRKLATLFHLVLSGAVCLGLAYSGCNFTLAVASLTLSLALNGAISAGLLSGIIDNSPNYSGVILGAVGTISINSALVSPMVSIVCLYIWTFYYV
ncbi:hypothetical protein ACKWTF_016412 [Chironomus riparius]